MHRAAGISAGETDTSEDAWIRSLILDDCERIQKFNSVLCQNMYSVYQRQPITDRGGAAECHFKGSKEAVR